jgi:ADP-ribose pyrophosphatase YjhB (NUDIX family)
MLRSAMLPWLLRIWRVLPSPLRFLYLRLRYGHFGIGVAALIRDDAGRILLVHRTYSRDEPWALPGGWLELSDGPIDQALQRELLEETGLHVGVRGVCAVERAGFAVVLLMDAELLDPPSDFRASAEVSEIAWAEPNKVGGLSHVNARLLRRVLG